MLYRKFYRNGDIAFTTRQSKLVVEQLPDTSQRFYTIIRFKQIQPPGPLQLQNVPWLFVRARVRGIAAVAVGQDIEVSSVDAKMEDCDVVVDRGDHVNLHNQLGFDLKKEMRGG